MKNKILVCTDLTEAAGHAIDQAVILSRRSSSELVLFHVFDKHDPSYAEVSRQLEELANKISLDNNLKCSFILREREVFDAIVEECIDNDYDLVVIPTHGVRGLRQKLFGPDIFKLVARIPIPVLVVQKESKLIEDSMHILLPVSTHPDFAKVIGAVMLFTQYFKSRVEIYAIHKAGFDWPQALHDNLKTAREELSQSGIPVEVVKEEQNVYSIGYSRQTLNYAHQKGAGVICVMTRPSKEYYFFADFDKENMLTNELHLPILCAGGGSGE